MTALVEMHDIHKAFGAVRALDGVNLEIQPGEVLGLVGDNAAGKSTLMKVLSGAYQMDRGQISVDGLPVTIRKPDDARALGIEMIYQDLALADNLDLTANIWMGREATHFGFLDRARMVAETRAIVDKLSIDVQDISQRVETLSGGQRQAVAIGRAMAFNARLIIMDEPTAALSPSAAEKVLDVIRGLHVHGVAVVIINHRTDEVRRVADRIATMRHGRIEAVTCQA